jgi:hypothetical protein
VIELITDEALLELLEGEDDPREIAAILDAFGAA